MDASSNVAALLPTLSRADLQALAKKHGVRANQKTESLISELDERLRFGLHNAAAQAAAADQVGAAAPQAE
eukprot:4106783-Prymnesium_polylepis.1